MNRNKKRLKNIYTNIKNQNVEKIMTKMKRFEHEKNENKKI